MDELVPPADPPLAGSPPAELPPEEKPMEIHKPHAAKTWNEFFIELGTIVLGILIALGLEQAVEAMHERELAQEAEAAIREEMADNVSRLEYRLSNQNCIQKRLDDISALVAGWADGKEIPAGIHIGVPGDIVFNDQRWQANLNSGRFSRESADAQATQTRFYTLAHVLEGVERDEMSAWDQLRALEYGSQFLDARLSAQADRDARDGTLQGGWGRSARRWTYGPGEGSKYSLGQTIPSRLTRHDVRAIDGVSERLTPTKIPRSDSCVAICTKGGNKSGRLMGGMAEMVSASYLS